MNDDPKNAIDLSNPYPHLIAVGENKNEIKCFYIAVEKQIITVHSFSIVLKSHILIFFILLLLGANRIRI